MSSSLDGHGVVLAVHVAAGTAGLVLGPLVALRTGPRRGGRLDGAYQVAIAAVTTTALGLVAFAPGRLWWLAPIAALTQAAAAGGWWLRRRGTRRPWQVRLLGGSYVSLVTALLVVSWGGWAAWVLPTLVGVLAVETAAERARRRTGCAPTRREGCLRGGRGVR